MGKTGGKTEEERECKGKEARKAQGKEKKESEHKNSGSAGESMLESRWKQKGEREVACIDRFRKLVSLSAEYYILHPHHQKESIGKSEEKMVQR